MRIKIGTVPTPLPCASLYSFSIHFLGWTTVLIVPAAVKQFTMTFLFAVAMTVKIATSIL